jgi:hypothetical protein
MHPIAALTFGRWLVVPGLLLVAAIPLKAQDQSASSDPFAPSEEADRIINPFEGGRTAAVNGTDVGQRQQAEDLASIDPMARIESRIPNRVQNRLRSRIDRFYDPRATTTSPFEVAGELTRRSGQPVPRSRSR